MSQIVTKFIGNDQVIDTKERLQSAAYLRSRNAANSADVNLIRANASDVIEFPSVPQIAAGSPSAANDITTVSYVATQVAGVSSVYKQAVVVVATSNLTLSGEQTIDGVLTSASRILVAGQTTASANGIYVTAAGAWSRSSDAASSAQVLSGMSVYVNSGTLYGNTLWSLATVDPITLGTTSLSFSKQTKLLNKENLTLNATDITNQYKDLAKLTLANSLQLFVNGVHQVEGSDYTLSTVGGVTRLTFAGDLATGGGAALVSGDILHVSYMW